MYHAGKRLSVGVQLVNPVPVMVIRQPPERLPAIICIGLSYHFSDDFHTAFEAEKDFENPLILRVGAEYRIVRPASIRIGISTAPSSFTFGFGLEFGKLKLDVASGYHQALGFSPAGSLTYSFK